MRSLVIPPDTDMPILGDVSIGPIAILAAMAHWACEMDIF